MKGKLCYLKRPTKVYLCKIMKVSMVRNTVSPYVNAYKMWK